jgi:hypothetical protein
MDIIFIINYTIACLITSLICSTEITLKVSSSGLNPSLRIISTSSKLSLGNNASSTPAFFAPFNLASNPPIAVTLPIISISPVNAILLFTFLIFRVVYFVLIIWGGRI